MSSGPLASAATGGAGAAPPVAPLTSLSWVATATGSGTGQPAVGTLTIAAQSPTATGGQQSTGQPAAATLTATGLTPTGSGAGLVVAAVAGLTATATATAGLGSGTGTPAASGLTVTGLTATATATALAAPAMATVATAAQPPTAGASASVSLTVPVNLVLAGWPATAGSSTGGTATPDAAGLTATSLDVGSATGTAVAVPGVAGLGAFAWWVTVQAASDLPRDEIILADVQARLVATGDFPEGSVYLDPPLGIPLPEQTPACAIRDLHYWDTIHLDPEMEQVTGRASIVLTIRAGQADDVTSLAELDRLSRVVRRQVHRQSLADMTIPELTICRYSRPTVTRRSGPNWQAEITLEYAYLVPRDEDGAEYDTGFTS